MAFFKLRGNGWLLLVVLMITQTRNVALLVNPGKNRQ